MAADEFESELDADIVRLLRKFSLEITKGNQTFVDEDLLILAHLADRAVKADLIDGLPVHVQKRLKEAR